MPGEAIVNKGITFTLASPSVFEGHNRKVQIHKPASRLETAYIVLLAKKLFKLNDVLRVYNVYAFTTLHLHFTRMQPYNRPSMSIT